MTVLSEALAARSVAEAATRAAVARAEAAEARVVVLEREALARDVIGQTTVLAASRQLSPLEVRGLLVNLPLTEAGGLDEEALEAAVYAAARDGAERACEARTEQRRGGTGDG